jgi:iron complex outermembrane receptor protein
LYGNSLLDVNGTPFQSSVNNGKFQTLVAQADLAWPFKGVGKLESGVKSTLRQVDNDQSVSYYQSATGDYLEDPLFSDQFSYDEQVVAAYSMFSGKWKMFEYNAGLRAEQTLISIYSRQANETFDNDYLKLFPSVFLKYNIEEKQEVQISYSRRINRPDSRQLNPFTDYSDSLSIRRGNPYLQPELINSFELSYAKNWEGGSFTSSIYHRHTDDLISRFRSVDTTTGISILTSVNFSSSDNTGWENILRFQAGKLGTVMASFNIFRNAINADNIAAELQSDATQWTGRLNWNIKLTSTTSLQVTANYVSVMKSPVGEVRGMSGVDAGLRQDVFKGKGSITFNVSDIFFTRKFRVYNYSDFHTYNGERIRESRIAMLTFSYRFGKMDNTQRRRGKPGEQRMGSDQPMEMMDF